MPVDKEYDDARLHNSAYFLHCDDKHYWIVEEILDKNPTLYDRFTYKSFSNYK